MCLILRLDLFVLEISYCELYKDLLNIKFQGVAVSLSRSNSLAFKSVFLYPSRLTLSFHSIIHSL